jgi:hypothetical protein
MNKWGNPSPEPPIFPHPVKANPVGEIVRVNHPLRGHDAKLTEMIQVLMPFIILLEISPARLNLKTHGPDLTPAPEYRTKVNAIIGMVDTGLFLSPRLDFLKWHPGKLSESSGEQGADKSGSFRSGFFGDLLGAKSLLTLPW